MTQSSDDSRNRPVVLETRAEPGPRHLRKPVRVLASATLVVAALSGAAGLAFGGSAVWSVVGPQGGNNAPVPLWFAPPSPVTQIPVRARDDDHRLSTTTTNPAHPTTTRGRGGEAEPGDPDHGATGGKAESGSGSGKAATGGAATGGGSDDAVTGGGAATHTEATHEATEPTADDSGHGAGSGGGGGKSTGGTGGGSDSAHGGGGGDDG
jgi:hypothetical protein